MTHPTPSPPTVFVVDDDPAIREGLSDLLASAAISSICFPSTEAFLAAWQPYSHGCLLLDICLPGLTGIDLQEQLNRRAVDIPIIFLTANGDIPTVRKVMKAGAFEFLTKPFLPQELMLAIQQAFDLHARLQAARAQRELLAARYRRLSPRELDVLRLVYAGLLNKQIAAELGLSEITVKLHRRHVMDKMQANSLADLVRMVQSLETPA